MTTNNKTRLKRRVLLTIFPAMLISVVGFLKIALAEKGAVDARFHNPRRQSALGARKSKAVFRRPPSRNRRYGKYFIRSSTFAHFASYLLGAVAGQY